MQRVVVARALGDCLILKPTSGLATRCACCFRYMRHNRRHTRVPSPPYSHHHPTTRVPPPATSYHHLPRNRSRSHKRVGSELRINCVPATVASSVDCVRIGAHVDVNDPTAWSFQAMFLPIGHSVPSRPVIMIAVYPSRARRGPRNRVERDRRPRNRVDSNAAVLTGVAWLPLVPICILGLQ